MSLKNNAVPGEAPESDSEEEINTIIEDTKKTTSSTTNVTTSNIRSPQGRIVAGEAPESDEEICDSGSVSSAASVSSIVSLTSGFRRSASNTSINKKTSPRQRPHEEIKYKTLLHRKLRERNMSLWRNVTELIHLTTSQATRDLNTADQQLLKSQGVLQETATQVKVIGTNLENLSEKLKLLTATPFLPLVQIPQELASPIV